MDIKSWISEQTRHPVTYSDLAEVLGVTRKTAGRRLNDQTSSDDIITLCVHYDLNPLECLVDFRYITHQHILDYFDSDGELVATASDAQLILELARRIVPAKHAEELDALEGAATPPYLRAVADSSPDEPEDGMDFDSP
ncbi:hypothetical protein ACFPVT_07910 [Corynebacterium choanae]|nr:hypothetical protein [Corynebacterium choanae]